ncbi:hypothetical protein D3C76_269980 [compost metagenome]
MHVDGVEAGTVEGRGHFHLAIDALFAQHCYLRTNAFLDVRRADVLVDVETELDAQARVFLFENDIEFLVGAFGVVTQALDLVAGFGPNALQQTTLVVEQHFAIEADGHFAVVDRLTDHSDAIFAQASGAELCQHIRGGVLTYLDHRTQFFVEEDGRDFLTLAGQGVELKAQAAMTGKGHFQYADQQPAIGAVVVGQQVTVGIQALDHGEEGLEVFGVVDVRCLAAQLAVGLREDRGAHAVLATAEVDQDQIGLALVHPQLRGQGLADVGNRSKTGDDQRQRRGDGFLFALFAPAGLHRHRVLAHRNGQTQLRAQLHADGLDRVVQAGVFTRMAGSRHPVGRQLDVGQFLDA